MQNLWNKKESNTYETDLELRVYTSQLLGRSDELVLHGGGNTSVKSNVNGEDILYVKGSGWDLVTIKQEGFSPVKLDALRQMVKLETLSDTSMVLKQKEAMIDKNAPNPSVEAILHAIIPFKYVDHTHSDAIVTISNSTTGVENIDKIFPNFLIVPYIMPGFILAKKIYDMSKDLNWDKCDGIILHNHGIFTFDDDAKKSYDKMIKAVSKADDFLSINAKVKIDNKKPTGIFDIKKLQEIMNKEKGYEVTMKINQSSLAVKYSCCNNLKNLASRGVLTPEHIIRTKRNPLIIENENIQESINDYKNDYVKYFNQFKKDEVILNSSPNWAVVKDYGTISFGKNLKEASIIHDINEHTMMAVIRADLLGGFKSISLQDSFDMEYWSLEQSKLKK